MTSMSILAEYVRAYLQTASHGINDRETDGHLHMIAPNDMVIRSARLCPLAVGRLLA